MRPPPPTTSLARNLLKSVGVILPGLLGVALFGVVIFGTVIPYSEDAAIGQRHQVTRDASKLVWDILSSYERRVKSGELNLAQAQERAKRIIRTFRYGTDEKNYFWMADLDAVTVMHPYRTDHEGMSQAGLTDAMGKHFVLEAVALARERGEGTITYAWQWMDDPQKILPKQTYVRLFEPWGWVVGTGIYLDDVHADIRSLTRMLTLVGAGVLFAVVLLAVYLAWRQHRLDLERQAAQAASQEAREQYRRIVETANEGIWAVDAGLLTTYVNQKIADMLGYTPGEMIGRGLEDFIHPGDIPAFRLSMDRRRRSQGETFERRYLHKDGHLVWVLVSASPILDAQGVFAGSFAMLTDITERKHVADVLAQRERNTQDMLESLPGMFYAISREGAFLRWNRNFELVTGYSAEEIARLSPLDLFQGADKELVRERIEEVFAKGYSSADAELVSKRGERIPYTLTGTRVELDGGPCLIGMGMDVSERRLAEQALKQSEAKYRALIEATDTGFVILDQWGRVLDANQEYVRLSGHATVEELLGRSVVEWTLPEDMERNRAEVEKCIARGFVRNLEVRYLAPGGAVVPVEINATVLDAPGGKIILSVCRDITMRKRAEQGQRLNTERMEALLSLDHLRDASLDELAAFTMEEAVRLTNSRIGYLAFASEDESVLTMHAWSRSAMAECAIQDKPLVYQVKDTGLWGEAIRRRGPVLTNDYQAPNPLKRGFPQGHVKVLRHMNVPIFDGEAIVIVAGVGNKEQEYDENDVMQLTLLMQGMWRLVRQKRAEQALRESEARFKALSDESPLGISLIADDGRYEYLNPAFTEMFGYDLSDIPTGKDWFRLAFPDPEIRQLVVKAWHGDLENIPPGVSRPRIFSVRCKDGGVKTILFRPVTIGAERQFLLYEDIGERLAAEESLKESERRYRELFNSISDLICTHDLDGRLITVNQTACQVLGRKAEDLAGRPLTDFMLPEYREDFAREYLPKIKEAGYLSGTSKSISRDGQVHYLEYRNRLVQEPGKEPYVIASGRDVTERFLAERSMRRLEEQLAQSQKMEAVGLLAGGVAHDFNNILQAISGYAQLLLRARGMDAVHRDYLARLDQAVRRGAELVHRLLTFGRKAEKKTRLVDLNHEVEQAALLLERTIPKMITLKLELASDLGKINADPSQLQQVLLNLANNARDAMPEGGELTMRTANVALEADQGGAPSEMPPGRYVALTVSDTGQGMPGDVLDHIFEPFFTTKDVGKGTGLGLATVYGIVKSHGGQISCQSRSGQGASFVIHLPVGAEADQSQSDPPQPELQSVGGAETILLVDDEEAILATAREALEGHGYAVLTAETGEKALQMFASGGKRIDMVILDLNMPGMGGRKCLAHLVQADPKVRVLVATGYADEAVKEEINALGAVAIIGKPYGFIDLLNTIRQVLDA